MLHTRLKRRICVSDGLRLGTGIGDEFLPRIVRGVVAGLLRLIPNGDRVVDFGKADALEVLDRATIARVAGEDVERISSVTAISDRTADTTRLARCGGLRIDIKMVAVETA